MLDPRSWVAYTDLARVRLAAGDTSGALESYQTAFKVAPTQLRVVTELAALYEKSGRIDAAIASYDALYKGGDSNTRQLAANNLAMLLVSYKTDPASLNRARALTVDFAASGNASFLDTLGWVHFKRREYRDAVIALERAADRSPRVESDSLPPRNGGAQAGGAGACAPQPRVGTLRVRQIHRVGGGSLRVGGPRGDTPGVNCPRDAPRNDRVHVLSRRESPFGRGFRHT